LKAFFTPHFDNKHDDELELDTKKNNNGERKRKLFSIMRAAIFLSFPLQKKSDPAIEIIRVCVRVCCR
jgi:hypothetical protein